MKYQKFSTLPIGLMFFAIALVMERFLPLCNLVNFSCGLLIGLSIVLIIYHFGILYQKQEKI
jgi:hypothetical protein